MLEQSNGGALEMAQYMAGHADPRTTKRCGDGKRPTNGAAGRG
jgi:hypothetical protein